MASAREQICPRIAAKNLVLAFPATYGRVSLMELVFKSYETVICVRRFKHTHKHQHTVFTHRVEASAWGFVARPQNGCKTYTGIAVRRCIERFYTH